MQILPADRQGYYQYDSIKGFMLSKQPKYSGMTI